MGLSTMGFALPAAVGAALLDREQPVGLALSFGAAAWSARDDVELNHAIGEALRWGGASLIEAKIDRSNYGATLRAVRG
jgi:thiamine pyrophosphate-dependent acetolactate synthase large subunit-like protein